MAESSRMRYWSGWLFNTKAPRPEQTSEHYIQLSIQCMERVRMMILPKDSKSIQVKFNYEQCKYLISKLERAIFFAHSFLSYHFYSKSLEDIKCLELYKILFMLAKEVEGFIQGCSKENWIQAAIILTNMSDHVCALGFDLEMCTIFFSVNQSQCPTSEEVSYMKNVDLKLVQEKAFIDDGTLLNNVRALIESSEASSDDCGLATFLLAKIDRSTFGTSGPLHLNLYERSDISSLTFVVKIGNGAFGTVYKAIWRGAEVAVKTFHEPENPVFKKEVSICAKVSHPNIASLLFYGVDNGECSIVMELMDEDLHSLMRTRLRCNRTSEAPFCLFIAIDLMLQIAEGMCYLHIMRIVHRDLKSQNILVKYVKSSDGGDGHRYVRAKVADFGLAGTKMRSMTYSTQTLHMGTTRWMAPEMIECGSDVHQKKYPFKSDVYSFGIVCYEILTGKFPFSNIHRNGEIKRRILAGDRPELPDRCPSGLRILIEKCWSGEAGTRPNFGDICSELRYLKTLQMPWGASKRSSRTSAAASTSATSTFVESTFVAASSLQPFIDAGVDVHATVQPLPVETVKHVLRREVFMRRHEDTSSAMSMPPHVNTEAVELVLQTEHQVVNREEELLAKATAVALQKMMVFSTPPPVNIEVELGEAPINTEAELHVEAPVHAEAELQDRSSYKH